jgi:hypothetical protein
MAAPDRFSRGRGGSTSRQGESNGQNKENQEKLKPDGEIRRMVANFWKEPKSIATGNPKKHPRFLSRLSESEEQIRALTFMSEL